MLQLNAAEEGLSWNLKAVPAAFLIHSYSEGVSPTIEALEAYAYEAPGGPVMILKREGERTNGERV